jgi:hypothetical protein
MDSPLYIVDDLIRSHVDSKNEGNVLAYPNVDGDISSYEYYTSSHMNDIINKAVSCLIESGASIQVGNALLPIMSQLIHIDPSV